MTRILRDFGEIAERYDVVLCDLWGCLHNGQRPYPEAVTAMRRFAEGGGTVVLLTNSPQLSGIVTYYIRSMGIPDDCWHLLVSSGSAAQAETLRGFAGKRLFHIGPKRNLGFFQSPPEEPKRLPITLTTLEHAEAIACSGLFDDTRESPDDYKLLLQTGLAGGLTLLCLNPDVVVDRGDSRAYCAGALAKLYEEMGGKVLYFGKPHAAIYRMVMRQLRSAGREVKQEQVICIGDGMETDIDGARRQGFESVLVTGGIAVHETGTRRDPDPDLLRRYLARFSFRPDYAIGYLR